MSISYKSILLTLFFANLALQDLKGQEYQRFNINVSAGMSKTGSQSYNDSYTEFLGSSTVVLSSSSLSRNNNYNFSIGFQPSSKISINGSIGVASYGFSYSGNVIASPINTASTSGIVQLDDFSTRLMEVGLSATYSIPNGEELSFLIQPGLVWYTNPKEEFTQVLGIQQRSNNFSTTLFTGIEVPISANNFYARIGFNGKLALVNFAQDDKVKFKPFAIGIQASISYKFLTQEDN